jgi:hypothetical protein
MHAIHIVAVCTTGLMTALAIAATAAPWTHAEAHNVFGTFKLDYSLWGFSTPAVTMSWSDLLNDEPACNDDSGTTNSDLLTQYRIAQAGAILSILGSIAFGILGLIYGLGKLSKKLLLLIPAIMTFAFAMMAYGAYTAAYTACSETLCDRFVSSSMARGAITAECGPAAGVFLVWAACALGLAALCMFMARTAGATVVRGAVIGVNATPYEAFPAQQPQNHLFEGQQNQQV